MTVGNRGRCYVKISAIWLLSAAMIVCFLISSRAFSQIRAEAGSENIIHVRLDGVTEYDLAKIFGQVIYTSPGVLEAKRFGSRIVPDNPRACFVNWKVNIKDTDSFRLQESIIRTLRGIRDRGGKIVLQGVAYRLTAAEMQMLKKIRAGTINEKEIQFVMDR